MCLDIKLFLKKSIVHQPHPEESPVDTEDDDGHGDAHAPGDAVDQEEDAVHHYGTMPRYADLGLDFSS